MEKYPSAFEIWWAENRELLKDDYQNYLRDIECTDEEPMSFKKWAFGVYQED